MAKKVSLLIGSLLLLWGMLACDSSTGHGGEKGTDDTETDSDEQDTSSTPQSSDSTDDTEEELTDLSEDDYFPNSEMTLEGFAELNCDLLRVCIPGLYNSAGGDESCIDNAMDDYFSDCTIDLTVAAECRERLTDWDSPDLCANHTYYYSVEGRLPDECTNLCH